MSLELTLFMFVAAVARCCSPSASSLHTGRRGRGRRSRSGLVEQGRGWDQEMKVGGTTSSLHTGMNES